MLALFPMKKRYLGINWTWKNKTLTDKEAYELFKLVQSKFKKQDDELNTNEDVQQENSDENEPLNFWWLNANPKIWSISSHQEGQKQTYTTHNEKEIKKNL